MCGFRTCFGGRVFWMCGLVDVFLDAWFVFCVLVCGFWRVFWWTCFVSLDGGRLFCFGRGFFGGGGGGGGFGSVLYHVLDAFFWFFLWGFGAG